MAEIMNGRDRVLSRLLLVHGGIGGIAWVGLAAAVRPDPWLDLMGWLRLLVILAPLCVVPLALRLVLLQAPAASAVTALLSRAAVAVVPLAGGACAIGAFLPRGPISAAVCAPWLLTAVLVALVGALRLWSRRRFPTADEAAVSAGLVYLPIGAAWLVASRLGITVLGFSEPWVLLTAAHFHYAGFTLPVVTGRIGREPRIPGRLYRTVAWLIALGPIVTALGITFSRSLESGAGFVLALAFAIVSGILLLRVAPHHPPLPRALLSIAAVTPWITMGMAALYALRGAGGPAPSLVAMARVHGAGNALGFALCAVVGLNLIAGKSPDSSIDADSAVE
jgi:hypothetical protein